MDFNKTLYNEIMETLVADKEYITEAARAFRWDMEQGLKNTEYSSLQMLPSFIGLPEGTETGEFTFHGKKIMPALCGDLWDAPERFKTDHLLIWPVYVNYTPEEWENGALDEYAEQALLVSGDTLMINPIDRNPVNHGGSFRFRDGTVTERIPYDEEQILIVDIP